MKWLAKILAIPWVFAVVVFFPLLLMIISETRTVIGVVRSVKLNKQLAALGLDPNDITVSALAEQYGIEIFLKAAEELENDKAAEKSTEEKTNDE